MYHIPQCFSFYLYRIQSHNRWGLVTSDVKACWVNTILFTPFNRGLIAVWLVTYSFYEYFFKERIQMLLPDHFYSGPLENRAWE